MLQADSSALIWQQLPVLGVEVHHDLSRPLTEQQGSQLVQMLWHYGLVLARGQRLSMIRQRELCELAGPILLRTGESGYLSTESGAEASLCELAFHADAAYTDSPFDALALHAIDVVDDASSTRYMSAERALVTLPEPLRQRLQDRTVDMISPAYDQLASRCCDRPDPIAHKRSERLAVIRNPHNGRDCLWVSELQTARLVGMAWQEGRDLLREVYSHMYRPEYVFEHRWRMGDFVMWDNIALQHARGSLKGCGKRILQRVIVGREGSVPHIPT